LCRQTLVNTEASAEKIKFGGVTATLVGDGVASEAIHANRDTCEREDWLVARCTLAASGLLLKDVCKRDITLFYADASQITVAGAVSLGDLRGVGGGCAFADGGTLELTVSDDPFEVGCLGGLVLRNDGCESRAEAKC